MSQEQLEPADDSLRIIDDQAQKLGSLIAGQDISITYFRASDVIVTKISGDFRVSSYSHT
jgi:hypothetical protein